MTERSIYNTIVSAELARWHEEMIEFLALIDCGLELHELRPQIERLGGLLPDDIRPPWIKPTPFVQKSKPLSTDDLL